MRSEAPKTRPGTEAKPKSKSTPKPAFDPKDTSQMGVKQLRPIINTDNDSPYASSPMASDGSSPFKPAKSKKIEADAPKTRSTRSKEISYDEECQGDEEAHAGDCQPEAACCKLIDKNIHENVLTSR